jgi:hypothetical protein
MALMDRLSNGLQPAEEITEEEINFGLKSLLRSGLATQAFVTFTGGPFVVAFALTLGASNFAIGLLAAFPQRRFNRPDTAVMASNCSALNHRLSEARAHDVDCFHGSTIGIGRSIGRELEFMDARFGSSGTARPFLFLQDDGLSRLWRALEFVRRLFH